MTEVDSSLLPIMLNETVFLTLQVRSMKRARDIRDQLEGLLERVEIELTSNDNDYEAIKKAITSGFFPHSAKLQKNGSYRTIKHPQTVNVHPSSGLAQVKGFVYYENGKINIKRRSCKLLDALNFLAETTNSLAVFDKIKDILSAQVIILSLFFWRHHFT